jgi:hypothetical protein
MIRRHLTYANVVATVCLVALLGGTAAFAASRFVGKDGKVYSCVVKKGKKKGQLRLIASKTKCKRSEEKLAWNQTGQRGPTGLTGPAGPTGPGTESAGVPTGAVMLFDADSCPATWTEYTQARGRYMVGRQPSGERGAVVGTELSDKEDRVVGQHNHSTTDPGHTHGAGAQSDILAGNIAVNSFQGNGRQLVARDNTLVTDLAATGVTVNNAGAVPGTNAPYVQLLACRKD